MLLRAVNRTESVATAAQYGFCPPTGVHFLDTNSAMRITRAPCAREPINVLLMTRSLP